VAMTRTAVRTRRCAGLAKWCYGSSGVWRSVVPGRNVSDHRHHGGGTFARCRHHGPAVMSGSAGRTTAASRFSRLRTYASRDVRCAGLPATCSSIWSAPARENGGRVKAAFRYGGGTLQRGVRPRWDFDHGGGRSGWLGRFVAYDDPRMVPRLPASACSCSRSGAQCPRCVDCAGRSRLAERIEWSAKPPTRDAGGADREVAGDRNAAASRMSTLAARPPVFERSSAAWGGVPRTPECPVLVDFDDRYPAIQRSR